MKHYLFTFHDVRSGKFYTNYGTELGLFKYLRSNEYEVLINQFPIDDLYEFEYRNPGYTKID